MLFVYWLIDWLIDWLVGWLTDWLIDWLIDWRLIAPSTAHGQDPTRLAGRKYQYPSTALSFSSAAAGSCCCWSSSSLLLLFCVFVWVPSINTKEQLSPVFFSFFSFDWVGATSWRRALKPKWSDRYRSVVTKNAKKVLSRLSIFSPANPDRPSSTNCRPSQFVEWRTAGL